MKTRPRVLPPSPWFTVPCLAVALLGCGDDDGVASSVDSALDGGIVVSDGGPSGDAAVDVRGLDSGAQAPKAPKCQPTGGKPAYLLEGETVTIKLSCGTGLAAAPGTLSFEELPMGATFDASSATLTWTPALNQAAVYELTAVDSVTKELGSVKIGVADRWNDPANMPLVDASKYTEEYGLPVIHLRVDPNINSDAYTPAALTYRGHVFEGAEAQTRGTFSASFPKRSYTIKTTKADKFDEPIEAGGFNKKRKIVLVSPFNDNSYVRTRLGFELWNKLDPEHIRIQSYSAVVFLNGAYHGLYTVVDHVDEYLMEDFGLSQEGNLYKARAHDANFRLTGETGKPKVTLHDGYTKEEGLPAEGEPGAFDDLDALVNWVATSTQAEFRDQADMRIVRKDYEDWWVFVSFIMAGDSIGKNSYHYHDPAQPGPYAGRWRFIPWDLDESFGQDYRTIRRAADSQSPEAGRYVDFNNMSERLLAEPTFGVALRRRLGSALTGAFDLPSMLALLDAMAARIEPSALRDEVKWGPTYRVFSPWAEDRPDLLSHKEEVKYVRQWIIDRHAFIDRLY